MNTVNAWLTQVLGTGLLVASVVACGLMCGTRVDGETPDQVFDRVAIPHRCSDPKCNICASERDWLRRNPGRYSGDMLMSGDWYE